jgi:glycosyltransferase involved in cell wall biosynthesis
MGNETPVGETEDLCKGYGITPFWGRTSRFGYDMAFVERALENFAPDLIHMHSVFIPRHVMLSYVLKQKRIPYVISPHGGVSPRVLGRQRWKKWPYGIAFEKPRFRSASAIIPITEQERQQIRAYVGETGRICDPVGNPVSIPPEVVWTGGTRDNRRIVSLARYDVHGKGLDRLVEIARNLPTAEFCVYGEGKLTNAFVQLKNGAPKNVSFLSPVHGAEKWEVLGSAAVYLQTSRWEAFGISIVEALTIGLPCASLPGDDFIGDTFRRTNTGLALPDDPVQAALQLEDLLSNRDSARQRAITGAALAKKEWSALSVAEKVLKCYEEALQHKSGYWVSKGVQVRSPERKAAPEIVNQ